jgi:signal recognition particle GTPase
LGIRRNRHLLTISVGSRSSITGTDIFSQRDHLENELDELREELLVAEVEYENAITIVERDAADVDCNRLRTEIKTRQQLLRTLKEHLRDGSAPTSSTKSPKIRVQAAGE